MATAILDIDGTLIDTNYQHALAWYRAFRELDIDIAIWRIHRHIGMGGDQMVKALTDPGTEDEKGEQIREAEGRHYMAMIEEVQPMESSRKLMQELKRRGHTVLLASSAKPEEVEHYLDLLDARLIADGWTTAGDVEATKPEPDLVQAALEKASAEPSDAVMIGDTPWDVEAAKRAGVPTIAVVTGGFSHNELSEAGAISVYESVAELLEKLDQTPLA